MTPSAVRCAGRLVLGRCAGRLVLGRLLGATAQAQARHHSDAPDVGEREVIGYRANIDSKDSVDEEDDAPHLRTTEARTVRGRDHSTLTAGPSWACARVCACVR